MSDSVMISSTTPSRMQSLAVIFRARAAVGASRSAAGASGEGLHRRLQPFAGQTCGERRARLPGPDDDRVEFARHFPPSDAPNCVRTLGEAPAAHNRREGRKTLDIGD